MRNSKYSVRLQLHLAVLPLLVVIVCQSAVGQTEIVLHSFTGSNGDGANPYAGLVMDGTGNLYGTTHGGGASGYGTVFKIDTAGQETVLYSFTGSNGDGANPYAGLIMDPAGNLYGTTYGGGTFGCGTVFKIDASGQETVLYSFTGSNGDGANPYAGLVMDATGNLFGTTYAGGTSGYGTVFKIDASRQETVLHSFAGSNGDGAYPVAGLIMDATGNLYGTTYAGGSCCGPYFDGYRGFGTVFKIDASGNETVLHNFTYSNWDLHPVGSLIMDTTGNLYGTTSGGGSVVFGAFGQGTVFKIDTSGRETVLCVLSRPVRAGLIMDVAGNFYTTGNGRPGTVLKVDPSGQETALHTMSAMDGANPTAALIMDAAGNLYGTAETYGSHMEGTVFELIGTGAVTFAPAVSIAPPFLVFGSSNSTLPVIVTNSGTAALNITATPSVAGFNSSDFAVTRGTTCTQGAAIPPGGSCVIDVSFTPLTDSAEMAGISLSDNANGSPQKISLSGGAALASIVPNPIIGSDSPQTVTITGLNFTDGAVIDWEDLTNGGSDTVTPLSVAPNLITASMTFGRATATWQIRIAQPDGSNSNWYTFQVLAADVPHSYPNDYPFQNAPYCPNSTSASSCPNDTKDPYIFFYRECTSFVAWRMNRDAATTDPRNPSFFNHMGNGKWKLAGHWKANADTLKYVADHNPEVGAVAQWVNGCGGDCSDGHVGYVEARNADGSIDVSEYNYAADDDKVNGQPGDHQFGIRTLSPQDTVFPQWFIHIPRISVSPVSLNFGGKAAGTSSSQIIRVTNSLSESIVLGISVADGVTGVGTSDFTEVDTCAGTSLAPGAQCEITVTFASPGDLAKGGTRSASIVLNWGKGPQLIPVKGVALTSLTPSKQTLSFGTLALGDTSQKTVTLKNNTGADILISSVTAASQDFTSTGCAGMLPQGASCTISVTFAPTATGKLAATLEISDDAINSPQTVDLGGTGVVPVALTPVDLTFSTRPVGSKSPAKAVTIKNNLSTDLAISDITLTGLNAADFSKESTCGTTLGTGVKCTVSITFTPTAKGSRVAVLNVYDGARTSPQTVDLTGTGK